MTTSEQRLKRIELGMWLIGSVVVVESEFMELLTSIHAGLGAAAIFLLIVLLVGLCITAVPR